MVVPPRQGRRVGTRTHTSPAEARKRKKDWFLRCLHKVVGVEKPSRDDVERRLLSRNPKTKGENEQEEEEEEEEGDEEEDLDLQNQQLGEASGPFSLLDGINAEDTTVFLNLLDGDYGASPAVTGQLDTRDQTQHVHDPLHQTDMSFSQAHGALAMETMPSFGTSEVSVPVNTQTQPHQNLTPPTQAVYDPAPLLPPLPSHHPYLDLNLRFVGPNNHPIFYAARIEPLTEISQVPPALAIALSYSFDGDGTPGEIFPIANRRTCFSSIGYSTPEWFIRDFGILFTPGATTPDLRVNISLAPTPEPVDEHTPADPALVRICFNLPYVIIGGRLLERMMAAGFQYPGLQWD
ncbi:hypothetical protein LIA77_01887 [Sarocladium implicatum]|nr:hypothetical protein LIA77_01887 [Sarocladium implicatum]